MSGLLRRLSADNAPTPLARALSANYNQPMEHVFHPPRRNLSPFQPPPLTPLSLKGYKDTATSKSRLLSKTLAEEIRLLVPPRLQLVDDWRLVYSLEQNGSSLATLYQKCEEFWGKRAVFVLVVRDGGGGIFGAYLTDAPRPRPHYYGTGECFLWRASVLSAIPTLASLPPPPSEDTTNAQRMTTIGVEKRWGLSGSLTPVINGSSNVNGNGQSGARSGTSTPERIRFKAFPYSGINDYMVFCETGFLSVGGGDGHYGLWLDNSLEKGVSSSCPTFGNEPLSDEGKKFDILGVELWYIGATG
ncbi:oxidation resistance protein 1 [Cryomyces antarcticus]|nr:oxidation resistance protein 1 [Cryomyces antarcticus]